MYTNTSKQILSPLAEAVFQLILTISDAEINDDPIPDLSHLARMVDEQTVNLVNIGYKIQNQPTSDDILKIEMPKACDEGGMPTPIHSSDSSIHAFGEFNDGIKS